MNYLALVSFLSLAFALCNAQQGHPVLYNSTEDPVVPPNQTMSNFTILNFSLSTTEYNKLPYQVYTYIYLKDTTEDSEFQMTNEPRYLQFDMNSYLTVLFTETKLADMDQWVWIPQMRHIPLQGKFLEANLTFRNGSFNVLGLSKPKNLEFTVTVKCFLAYYPEHLNHLRVEGYIGLAPLIGAQTVYSFTRQLMRQQLKYDNIEEEDKLKLGIFFDIYRNTDLGIPSGFITFFSDPEQIYDPRIYQEPLQIKKDKTSNFLQGLYDKKQFLNNMRYNFSQVVTPEQARNYYFNNSYMMNLGRFISDMEIQGFKTYKVNGRERPESENPNTYFNMSEIGTKIDPDYFDYLRQSFINQTCNMYLSEQDKYRMCSCRGNNFQGMPLLTLNTFQDKQFRMHPKDYLLFPSIEERTRQTKCGLGVLKTKNFVFQINETQKEQYAPFLVDAPIGYKDYVLGQQFFVKFNPYFVFEFGNETVLDPDGQLVKLPILTTYIEDDEVVNLSYDFLICMTIFSIVLIVLSTVLSRKRAQRIREEIKRWKEIKELEEDYNVYVSDEYAYHIADSKLRMHQIQDLGIANLDQGYGKVRRSGSVAQSRRLTLKLEESTGKFEEVKRLSNRSSTILEGDGYDEQNRTKNKHSRLLSMRSDATLNGRNHSYSFIKERVD